MLRIIIIFAEEFPLSMIMLLRLLMPFLASMLSGENENVCEGSGNRPLTVPILFLLETLVVAGILKLCSNLLSSIEKPPVVDAGFKMLLLTVPQLLRASKYYEWIIPLKSECFK